MFDWKLIYFAKIGYLRTWDKCCYRVCSNRVGDNDFKLKQTRFKLHFRMKLATVIELRLHFFGCQSLLHFPKGTKVVADIIKCFLAKYDLTV